MQQRYRNEHQRGHNRKGKYSRKHEFCLKFRCRSLNQPSETRRRADPLADNRTDNRYDRGDFQPGEKIRQLVNKALPGVTINPAPVPPRQIPLHTGFVYFELDQSSALWGELRSSGGLAMHLSGEFPGLALELWAIRR